MPVYISSLHHSFPSCCPVSLPQDLIADFVSTDFAYHSVPFLQLFVASVLIGLASSSVQSWRSPTDPDRQCLHAIDLNHEDKHFQNMSRPQNRPNWPLNQSGPYMMGRMWTPSPTTTPPNWPTQQLTRRSMALLFLSPFVNQPSHKSWTSRDVILCHYQWQP